MPAQLHAVTTGPTAVTAQIAKINECRIGYPVRSLDNLNSENLGRTSDESDGHPDVLERSA